MSLWSLYFLAKLALFYLGHLQLKLAWNFALAAVVFWPVKNTAIARVRTVLAGAAAFALAWQESPLPPLSYALQQLRLLAGFSHDYLLELASRLISPEKLLIGAIVLAVYALLSLRVRMATFVWLGLLSAAVWPGKSGIPQPPAQTAVKAPAQPGADSAQPADAAWTASDATLARFFEQEQSRRLAFHRSPTESFDVIVLHVCSLSWDDMEYVNLMTHPLIRNSSIIFTRFNSATSYSGPAALRLLQGACGQRSHESIYQSSHPECYVFPSLENAGFKTQALLNHDGKFDSFAHELEARGGMRGKLLPLPADRKPALRSFDGSPIYRDYDVLSDWLRQHKDASQPQALYYNTITLHDGVHAPGQKSGNSLSTYPARLRNLLDDFERFIQDIKASGRPTVVIMVPEHGANLRGDSMQIAGMREIPSPRITLVPTLVFMVNAQDLAPGPLKVDTPVSYFDLFSLLDDLLLDSPFRQGGSTALDARVRKLQGTPFVTESATVTVMSDPQGGHWLHTNGSQVWVPYSE